MRSHRLHLLFICIACGLVRCGSSDNQPVAVAGEGAADGSSPVPLPDECAQLRTPEPGPAPRSAFQYFSRSTGDEYCRPGYVAGSGTLALPKEDPNMGYGTTLLFVRSTGETLGKREGPRIDAVTEQLDGFVVQNVAGGGQYWVTAFDSFGGSVAEAQYISDLHDDPTVGVVAVQVASPGMLNSYDAQLGLRFSLSLPPKSAPLAVDRAGNTLMSSDGSLLYGTGSIAAFWVDRAGAMGPVFMLIGRTGSIAQSPQAAARVGSGLFIATDGRWTLQIDSLSTKPTPAPAWLASRPVREMRIVHGDGGYAILPSASDANMTGDCVQSIEVVAPSGKSCGTSTFRAASGSCQTNGIRVGYDGTVVQQLPSSAEYRCPATGMQCACTWQWWPGFFR